MADDDGDGTRTVAPTGRGLRAGTLLNGLYRIEERLGEGGMGEVYRAVNITDDEVDAVKIIGRGLGDHPQVEALFRREARVLRSIQSSAVAQLRVFARDPQLNLLYFATEFVPGVSLLDRLEDRAAAPGELRALLRRVLTGLQAVHEAGAVHRDLSPDNIILPDGAVDRAKIIDFGIVKELDAKVTLLESFTGKYGYCAPEQLGFTGAKVGPWTDLYSLALVCIAFAAGKPLAMGHTPGTAEEARRRPIDFTALPADLRPLFERLLVYDWRQRVQSAAEALALLDEPLTRRLADPPASDNHPDTPPRRPRWPLYVAATAALLVLLLALDWWRRPGPPALAQPGLAATVTASGLRYQEISRGDGATRAPRHGQADVTIEGRQTDGRIAEAEHRATVRVDDPSIAFGEALVLMSRGAHWRIWAPAQGGNAALVYDVTLNEVGGAGEGTRPVAIDSERGLQLARPVTPGPPVPSPTAAPAARPSPVPTPTAHATAAASASLRPPAPSPQQAPPSASAAVRQDDQQAPPCRTYAKSMTYDNGSLPSAAITAIVADWMRCNRPTIVLVSYPAQGSYDTELARSRRAADAAASALIAAGIPRAIIVQRAAYSGWSGLEKGRVSASFRY